MYEEAESLSSSILKKLRNDDTPISTTTQDMFQSTSMVLVQAFNQLGKQVPFTFFSIFHHYWPVWIDFFFSLLKIDYVN